jgi:hypothetical protein
MSSTQQAQLLQVQCDVRICCEGIAQLHSKIDALQSASLQLPQWAQPVRSSQVTTAEQCKRARAESAASTASPFDGTEIFGAVLGYVAMESTSM